MVIDGYSIPTQQVFNFNIYIYIQTLVYDDHDSAYETGLLGKGHDPKNTSLVGDKHALRARGIAPAKAGGLAILGCGAG